MLTREEYADLVMGQREAVEKQRGYPGGAHHGLLAVAFALLATVAEPAPAEPPAGPRSTE